MKYRGKDDIIVGRATDRETYQTKVTDVKSFQIWVGRMVPTGSHRKRLAEQGGFHAPRSTRRRHVRSVEQHKDEVVPGDLLERLLKRLLEMKMLVERLLDRLLELERLLG